MEAERLSGGRGSGARGSGDKGRGRGAGGPAVPIPAVPVAPVVPLPAPPGVGGDGDPEDEEFFGPPAGADAPAPRQEYVYMEALDGCRVSYQPYIHPVTGKNAFNYVSKCPFA